MGQAKLRGTKEQRVAEGEAKRLDAEMEFERQKMERWKAMTPRQRKRELNVAQFMIMAGSLDSL